MNGRFAAFSFVDRIESVEPGKSISGLYHIPDHVGDFRHALCCEAVGQCAAWSAMADLEFGFQPVAGISRSVEFLGEAKPGDTLVLTAEISNNTSEAVAYDGLATVGGRQIVRLNQCLGPMLPMADFDDVERMSERYRLLVQAGAPPGAFPGIPEFEASVVSSGGDTVQGQFTVPSEADFFDDHFPRKPVFPGTLFIDLCVRFASQLVDDSQVPLGVGGAKLREFMEPGTELGIIAKKKTLADGSCEVDILLEGPSRPRRVVRVPFGVR